MNNFYLLYGNDISKIKNEINNIIKQLNISDIVKYSMDTNTIDSIIEDASTISMFSNKKIIVLEECNFFKANKTIDNLDKLESYLTKYNSDSYIIFTIVTDKVDTRKKIYKEIKKIGKIIECNKGDNNYLLNYIKDYTNENNYKIEDINYLINKTGSNLNDIKNELDKLFMYKIDNKIITNNDIDKIVVTNMDNEIFDLTDAVIAGDVTKSLSLLNEFLNKNYDEIQIIMLLASQFRFLYQVKRLMNKNKNYTEIASILEVNPYRVKYTIKKLYSYSETMLLNYIKRLAKMDQDIKTGYMDKKLALELFIIKKETYN